MCEKSVLDPIPHTQHRPICVSVNPVIVAQHTTFKRRFNLKKTDWEGFSADHDSNIEEVDAIPENYEQFVEMLMCLPTPVTLVCGGSPIIPLLVHQPAYPSIWPATPLLNKCRGDSVVCMWVQLKRWCESCVLFTGFTDLASTLCKYDSRKGNLFVLSCARV